MNMEQYAQEHPNGWTLTKDEKGQYTPVAEVYPLGYVVGITDNKITAESLKSALVRMTQYAHTIKGRVTIGGWRDDDGSLYVDVGIVVDTLPDVRTLCRLFNQKAFYCIHTGEVFTTKDLNGVSE